VPFFSIIFMRSTETIIALPRPPGLSFRIYFDNKFSIISVHFCMREFIVSCRKHMQLFFSDTDVPWQFYSLPKV